MWRPFPPALLIDGLLTADRSVWMTEAQIFQNKRYTDPYNSLAVRIQKMYEWRSITICERIEGVRGTVPSIWCFLQPLTSLSLDKSKPYGSPPVEFYRYMPFAAKLKIVNWFRNYLSDLRAPRPETWEKLQYTGIPNDGEYIDFPGIRWIGKTAAELKW